MLTPVSGDKGKNRRQDIIDLVIETFAASRFNGLCIKFDTNWLVKTANVDQLERAIFMWMTASVVELDSIEFSTFAKSKGRIGCTCAGDQVRPYEGNDGLSHATHHVVELAMVDGSDGALTCQSDCDLKIVSCDRT